MVVADREKNIRHRSIVAAAGVVFVFAQGLDEIIFALACEARDILLAGIISLMAEVAAVLLDKRAGAGHSRLVDRAVGGFGRRELGEMRRHVAQIVVCESLHHLIHELDDPELRARRLGAVSWGLCDEFEVNLAAERVDARDFDAYVVA